MPNMVHLNRVAVIGAGAMGTGFAAHFALHGLDVTLVDHRQANLDEARTNLLDIVRFLEREGLADVEPESVLEQVILTLDHDAGVEDAALVLETASERLDVKREIVESAGRIAPDHAVLASNTSSLSISAIAAGTPEHADRVVGCHWWYPPYLLRPVEVVRGEETSQETVERTKAFVEQVDRDPIVVEHDVPGFVWNRVQFAVVRECMHMATEGIASIEDINRAIRDGYARRTAVIGPFETIDVAGVDLFRTIADELYPHLCDADEPHELFDEYRARGRGGVEDGAGFFEYETGPDRVIQARDEKLAALRRVFDTRVE